MKILQKRFSPAHINPFFGPVQNWVFQSLQFMALSNDDDNKFLNHNAFSGEGIFHTSDKVYWHNYRIWGEEHPHPKGI